MPLTRGGPCLVSGGLAHLLIHTAVAIAIKSVGCCRNHYQTVRFSASCAILELAPASLFLCGILNLSLQRLRSRRRTVPPLRTEVCPSSNSQVSLDPPSPSLKLPQQTGSCSPRERPPRCCIYPDSLAAVYPPLSIVSGQCLLTLPTTELRSLKPDGNESFRCPRPLDVDGLLCGRRTLHTAPSPRTLISGAIAVSSAAACAFEGPCSSCWSGLAPASCGISLHQQ